MANHTPVEPDPKQVQNAEALWGQFTEISKWSIIAICILLIILAAAFIPFS